MLEYVGQSDLMDVVWEFMSSKVVPYLRRPNVEEVLLNLATELRNSPEEKIGCGFDQNDAVCHQNIWYR